MAYDAAQQKLLEDILLETRTARTLAAQVVFLGQHLEKTVEALRAIKCNRLADDIEKQTALILGGPENYHG